MIDGILGVQRLLWKAHLGNTETLLREDWEKSGKTDVTRRADEEARHILETHKPEPLPAGILDTLRSIVEEAEEESGLLRRKGKV